MKISIKAIYILTIFLLSSSVVQACTPYYVKDEEGMAKADVAFLGTAIKVESSLSQRDGSELKTATTTFDVSTVWKGKVHKNAKIVDSFITGYTCSAWMGSEGSTYLIFGNYSSTTDTFTPFGYNRVRTLENAQSALGIGKAPLPDESKPNIPTPKKKLQKTPPASKASPATQAMSTTTKGNLTVTTDETPRPSILNRIFIWFKNLF